IDDYGDVYGTFYAVTGDGFSYKELKDYTDFLKQELSLVPGVAKVELVGNRQEAIFVDISRTRMSQLGISLTQIYQTLAAQNLVSTSGSVRVGDEYIRITPTGKIDSVAAIGDLLIHSTKSKKLLHLDDVATITRGYEEVPHNLIFYDGKPAIGVGISIVSGGNVVKIGQAVDQKLAQLQKLIPIGININSVYEQPKLVQQSVQSFVVSLLEALAIVFAVLLLFMGLRSGMIISAILMLTILGTLLLMYVFHIDLQRISLGALIIALGMLVDNAIVVTESILMKVQAGIDKLVAARDVVKQTSWPLFGATIVGILAFAPISLSQDSTGEYTRSLFYVISISLLLSWLFAVMIAPLFCHLFLPSKSKTEAANAESQLYNGAFYRCYKKFLIACLHKRWLVIIVMIVLLGSAVLGFKHVKQSFFPNATTPIFYVDYWRPQGSDIRATNRDMLKIDKYIKGLPGVDAVTGIVGQGAMRFMLVYKPENANSSYGQFVVKVGDYHQINALGQQILEYLTNNYPNSEPRIKRVMLGTGGDAKIEVRFSGPDANELRHLSSEAQAIMRQNSNTIEIRDDWRQRVKVIEPVFSQMQARLTGITRADLATALDTAFAGKAVGVYRDGDTLIPIVSRPPDNERLNIANIDDLQIWSPLLSKTVPIGQIVSKFNTNWEDSLLAKRDRKLTITVSCNPVNGMLASKLFKQLKPKIEAIKTPAGYEMQWGGEYEDSHDAQAALAQKLPIGFLAMFLVVVLLFNSIRQPLIIWLCVPLALIGVTAGLLITNVEFGFMALLGFLSLSGMLIKNAIVLVDQIDFDIKAGKQPWQAIIDSSLSRMRPVMLAAITTVLGMIPLLFDIFFANMAVTIMFGLTFATILTLVVVPVLYAILFKVRPKNV
ncbi:MAG: efflux RND transporter permease subunit, partial [Gammaproteobacteria bacterium]|nr:efflux RND transporter permease subunit [Gammaproteobacteria bacterium]